MGLIQDAANRLKNALGDLFPEEQPSAIPLFPINGTEPNIEPTITIRKSAKTPPSNPEQPLGKITSYNYRTEELPDTNSQNMLGAWNNTLTTNSFAVSPDIEKRFQEAGIKPKDKVLLTLEDGTQLERFWDDRTMQDKQAIKKFGKPLRGRFDLHSPQTEGPSELDGTKVVGFRRIADSN